MKRMSGSVHGKSQPGNSGTVVISQMLIKFVAKRLGKDRCPGDHPLKLVVRLAKIVEQSRVTHRLLQRFATMPAVPTLPERGPHTIQQGYRGRHDVLYVAWQHGNCDCPCTTLLASRFAGTITVAAVPEQKATSEPSPSSNTDFLKPDRIFGGQCIGSESKANHFFVVDTQRASQYR